MAINLYYGNFQLDLVFLSSIKLVSVNKIYFFIDFSIRSLFLKYVFILLCTCTHTFLSNIQNNTKCDLNTVYDKSIVTFHYNSFEVQIFTKIIKQWKNRRNFLKCHTKAFILIIFLIDSA